MKKMLRNKLAMLLANLKKKRPYYCEVEYLESTGTQYIDTGIVAKSGLSSVLNFEYTALSGTASMLDARSGNNRFYLCHTGKPSTTFFFYYGYGSAVQSSMTPTVNTRYLVETSLAVGSQSMKVNGTTIASGSSSITYNLGANLYLFGMNYNTPQYLTSAKLYRCKIIDGSTLVRDFIPVLDWNYVPCMYDKVTGQLFYNAGTGSFLYGREIHYVDYLESDGTQYIDTGIKLTNNHSVEVDYQLTSARQNRKGIFGGLVSNGSRFGTLLSPSNEYLEFGYGYSNVWYQTGLPDTQRHIMKQQKNLLYFDGVLIHTFSTATFTQNFTAPLGSFAYTNYAPASAKYYGSRWWDGNDLVRDYKPAIDENGVCFWFDKVSHSVFLNAGTGVFSYPARETEYTGNAGTAAYIDLGAKYKPSMSIKGKYTRDTSGSQGSVILVTTTTSAPLIYLPALSGSTTERFVWRRGGYTEQSFFVNGITYPYTVEMVVDAVNDTLTLNGNVVKTGMIAGMNGYNSPYQSDSNMYMFSIAGSYAGDGKVHYLKIKDGTTPLFDLMPAYKDGDAGFYNKVTGVFFKNASTNDSTYLVAGKIVEPEYE